MLISGFPPFNMNTTDVRRRLTGISFVTKENHDIEEQLADISASYLSLEARSIDNLLTSPMSVFDSEIIKILKSKTFRYQSTNASPIENSFRKFY